MALGLPFLILGLTGPVLAVTSAPPGTETHTVTLLAAALVPVAACAGLALRARSEADRAHRGPRGHRGHAARAHRPRGTGPHPRELHDVVAHHISMIAVQAETARLTPRACRAAAAQRLRSIGDTARGALTEMRRLLGVLREDTGDTRRGTAAAARPGAARSSCSMRPGTRPLAGTRLIVSGRRSPSTRASSWPPTGSCRRR